MIVFGGRDLFIPAQQRRRLGYAGARSQENGVAVPCRGNAASNARTYRCAVTEKPRVHAGERDVRQNSLASLSLARSERNFAPVFLADISGIILDAGRLA